jgi:HK97 family phage prohead protease
VERNSFSLKIKSVAADGTFTGLGAVYNNVDLGGDKILPGAFSRTLAGSKSYPLLWQHDPASPIGSVKVTDTSQGLQCEGSLLLEDPTARKAYSFLKAGILKGLSIGYDTIDCKYVDDIRELSQLRLWELSIVTFPMNTEATITSVKAMSDSDRAVHLKAIDGHRRAIDRHQRQIRMHLKSMIDDLDDDGGLDDDEDLGDPAFIEGGVGEDGDGEEMGFVLQELKALAAQAEELASA